MQQEEINAKIEELLQELTINDETVKECINKSESRLVEDLLLDSLDLVELEMLVDDVFSIDVKDEVFVTTVFTVGDLRKLVFDQLT